MFLTYCQRNKITKINLSEQNNVLGYNIYKTLFYNFIHRNSVLKYNILFSFGRKKN